MASRRQGKSLSVEAACPRRNDLGLPPQAGLGFVREPRAREWGYDRHDSISSAARPSIDGRGRAYVPDSVDVISATRLLNAGERQTLSLTAPNEEGENEFVCTFPGHYQLMWGKLIVTKDVDAYLQKHPEAPAVGAGTTAGHHHAE